MLLGFSTDKANLSIFSLGLWQFLIDLPYSVVSETCRYRCQLLLRNKDLLSPSQLYEIADNDLSQHLERGRSSVRCIITVRFILNLAV